MCYIYPVMDMEGKMPLIGEKFPEMDVVTTMGSMKLPDQYNGKWFVLFSHPGDFTPVCTTEFYSFALKNDRFQELGVSLIGLSVDSKISHIEWIEWIKENLKIDVPFPIIADSMGTVANRLGMIHAESATSTIRAVFIVDTKGIIRAILYYPLETGRNIQEILRLIKSLQMVDKYKVVTPANWPENEMIGDHFLNSPPGSIDQIPDRLKKYKGYSWWLTYQDAPKNEVDEAKKITNTDKK